MSSTKLDLELPTHLEPLCSWLGAEASGSLKSKPQQPDMAARRGHGTGLEGVEARPLLGLRANSWPRAIQTSRGAAGSVERAASNAQARLTLPRHATSAARCPSADAVRAHCRSEEGCGDHRRKTASHTGTLRGPGRQPAVCVVGRVRVVGSQQPGVSVGIRAAVLAVVRAQRRRP